MSNSRLSHGLQPTRLFCPQDCPGKNIGMGCHFLLQRIFLTQGSNHISYVSWICRWVFFTTSNTWEALIYYNPILNKKIKKRLLILKQGDFFSGLSRWPSLITQALEAESCLWLEAREKWSEGKSETLESGKGLILPCEGGPLAKHKEESKEPLVLLKLSRGPSHAHPDF